MAGDLDGVGEMLAQLRAIAARVQQVTPEATLRAGHLVERTAKTLLSLTSHELGTPTPSQPGQPPSIVSGDLRRSITVRGPTRSGAGHWTVTVGPSMVYGRIQELGGEAGNGAVLPPRPYMRPAQEALQMKARSIFIDAWRDVIT